MSVDYEELMERAYELPEGRAKLAVLEEAVRAADSLGDIDAGYEARSEIVESGIFNGYPMKVIVAFSWQLGQFDKEPERFDDFTLLWSYKWIADKVACFPEVPREQIDNLLEDLKKRYLEFGYNERTYYYYKSLVHGQYGELEESARYMEKFKSMDADEMANCDACEQNREVEFNVMVGRDELALKAARPILDGTMTCGEVPHVTLSMLLLPMHRLGQAKEAEKIQKQGYRLIKTNREFLLQIGEHIRYLALTDPFKGLELFEHHVAHSLDHENPYDIMMFNAYSARLFRQLAKETVAFQVKLPAGYPHPEHATDVAALAAYLQQQALSTATRLDHRNGNSYYTDLVNSL
ncbi:hypothetical protein [Paenibacillus donghaensis]|uniref:Uncharacterized protein n=1 Tax=Paenibacillus donghaensis TaxID=414771 RepID=A0A2Z2K474_9BACL|nr:hypothetical protein [Paenibacillus donghaensis]ASA20496.1 hypothetical protein B9T62_06575 [Paenibacillus donghaensis]